MKADTMHVLISSPSPDTAVNVSGISSLVDELSTALRGRVRYEFVTLGAPQTGGWMSRRTVSLRYILRAMRTVLWSPASIFHSNTAFDVKSIVRDLVLIALSKVARKRVLLHVHGGRFVHEAASGLVRVLLRCLFGLADRVIFLSNTELGKFKQRHPYSQKKMIAMYNAVDLTDVDQEITPPRDGDALLVAFVGRLTTTKGLDVVVEAARAKYPCEVLFYVFGDGPLRDLIDREAITNPRLIKAGVFSRNHWREVLARYDVLLLPSVSGEGMPMVILEGMAVGLVPITTSIASIPEIVEDGVRGLLVPSYDTPAVVRAISRLAEDRALLHEIREACRTYARANFDIRTSANRLFTIYREMLYH